MPARPPVRSLAMRTVKEGAGFAGGPSARLRCRPARSHRAVRRPPYGCTAHATAELEAARRLPERDEVEALVRDLGLSETLAAVLVRRGITRACPSRFAQNRAVRGRPRESRSARDRARELRPRQGSRRAASSSAVAWAVNRTEAAGRPCASAQGGIASERTGRRQSRSPVRLASQASGRAGAWQSRNISLTVGVASERLTRAGSFTPKSESPTRRRSMATARPATSHGWRSSLHSTADFRPEHDQAGRRAETTTRTTGARTAARSS